MDSEIIARLSDAAIIAQARSAIVDVRMTIANSHKLIAETKHLLDLIVGSFIKIDRG